MQLLPQPKVQFFDGNGDPLNGGLVYTYAAGSTTAQATYTVPAGGAGNQNTNPVVLNARGEANIWYDPTLTYKIVLKDSAGVQIWAVDNVGGSGSTTTLPWAIAAGTADAITATYTPANTTLTDGLLLTFRAASANATTTPTFAPDGLTAHTITRLGGKACAPGDIPGQYAECFIRYNLTNTRWELLNPQNVQVPWIAAGGTADAITATYSPAITALTDGLLLSFRASAANATTTPTFSPSGLTAHTITLTGGTALDPGNISANLAEYFLRYNLANTRWELLNPTQVRGIPTVGTPIAATGVVVDITDFPSWAKRVSLLFSGISTASSDYLIAIMGGTGTTTAALETTGYQSMIGVLQSTAYQYMAYVGTATTTKAHSGRLDFIEMDHASNLWIASGADQEFTVGGTVGVSYAPSGKKALASQFSRLRITSITGTATFTAGTFNTLYE